MLAQLDYDFAPSAQFEAFLEGLRHQKLRYYASELQQHLALANFTELTEAVNRAISVCRAQRLPVEENFKPIYRCEKTGVIHDWKLSPLAYCLVMLNSNPRNEKVAQLQLQLVYASLKRPAEAAH